MKTKILFILSLVLLANFCRVSTTPGDTDDYYDSFFLKAQFIMTKEEIQIYKHLPDNDSRKQFIIDFWENRDPTPDTEENEAKNEFERRIEYARRWFKENRSGNRGWSSTRGRILLQLGEPEHRQLREMLQPSDNDRLGLPSTTKAADIWLYGSEYNHLRLIFVDLEGFGEFRLLTWPASLLSALDLAQERMLALNLKGRTLLIFDIDWENDILRIDIPIKKVSFVEKNSLVAAEFVLWINVYHNYKKIDTRREVLNIESPKEDLLKEKTLSFNIPLPLEKKGRYYLDTILEEVSTKNRSRSGKSIKN